MHKAVLRYKVLLTKAEWNALNSIVGNGWGDGDFEGYGGQSKKVQHSAIQKLNQADLVKIYLPKTSIK